MSASIAIAAFPGENGLEDLRQALEAVGGAAQAVPPDRPVPGWARAVCLPGGFAHGDALRPGALARLSPLVASLGEFIAEGGWVLGICNGFQVLLEAGLLPGALRPNRTGRFVARWTDLEVRAVDSPYFRHYRPGQVVTLPIAHRQGRFWAPEPELDRLTGAGRVPLVYRPADPEANPNGSARGVAAVLGAEGRVLGLMPHPERAADPLLGPPWGAPLLRGLVEAVG